MAKLKSCSIFKKIKGFNLDPFLECQQCPLKRCAKEVIDDIMDKAIEELVEDIARCIDERSDRNG